MSSVDICNIQQIYEGKTVGHKFDIVVESDLADGDGKAEVMWFERTDRKYDALEENEVWEDLFKKFRTSDKESNLFREAYIALPGEGEDAGKVHFTIHDEPSVTIGGAKYLTEGAEDTDSRRLDFIIIVRLTENDIYIAMCQQVIEVEELQKKLIRAEFKTTGFLKQTAEETEHICLEVSGYRNTPLEGILDADGLSRLQTVSSFAE